MEVESEGVMEGVAPVERDAVGDALRVVEAVRVVLGVLGGVLVAVAVGLPVPEPVAVGDAVGLAVRQVVGVPEALAPIERVLVGLVVGEELRLSVLLGVTELVGVPEPEGLGVLPSLSGHVDFEVLPHPTGDVVATHLSVEIADRP